MQALERPTRGPWKPMGLPWEANRRPMGYPKAIHAIPMRAHERLLDAHSSRERWKPMEGIGEPLETPRSPRETLGRPLL